MNNESVWIKVKVPSGLHSALRIKAFGIGHRLGEYVIGVLTDHVDMTLEPVNRKQVAKASESVKLVEVTHESPKVVVAKPDQSTCKHKFTKYTGRGCVHCGWEPPIV